MDISFLSWRWGVNTSESCVEGKSVGYLCADRRRVMASEGPAILTRRKTTMFFFSVTACVPKDSIRRPGPEASLTSKDNDLDADY